MPPVKDLNARLLFLLPNFPIKITASIPENSDLAISLYGEAGTAAIAFQSVQTAGPSIKLTQKITGLGYLELHLVRLFPLSIINLLAHPIDMVKEVIIGDFVINRNIELVRQHQVIEIKLNFRQQAQINILTL